MRITITKGSNVHVTRTDPKERYRTESALFHAIKLELKRMGIDCIKRCPGRDGHLTSAPYYIRSRQQDCRWCIHDGDYQIRCAHEAFNNCGEVVLTKVGEVKS